MSEYYSYIFVRQDLTPEQQLIQFGHAACVMGKSLPPEICPHKLSFVGIGVKNEVALVKAMIQMERHGIAHHPFIEPDQENTYTAVASAPVSGLTREAFRTYNTLRFQEKS